MARRRLLALSCVALLLVGCGDDGDDGQRVGDSTSSTRRTTTSSSSTTTSSPASTTSSTTTTVAPPPTTGTPAPAPPTTTVAPLPPFTASIETVTAEDLYASWRTGCPVPVEQLRAVNARHVGNDGKAHTGRVIVAANLANGMVEILRDLYEARYPIARMVPIDAYGGDDMKSMRANNTSAFNCRAVTGGSSWSEHAYGRAIDVNPFVNPYVKGNTVLPPESAPYADRSRNDKGMIHAGDATVDAFAAQGWKWGGYWSSLKDYQHFSTSGK